MNLSPIVLFVYNRPWHTKQTIESLEQNLLADKSELIIYSDGAKNKWDKKNVDDVRSYLRTIKTFKSVSITERKKNWGLSGSIIDGVTKTLNEYGKIIVLEDDLVISPYFLNYMNDALIFYEEEEQVASIHGYMYPIDGIEGNFFIKGADCWGWATWKRAWDKFEPDGNKLLKELTKRKAAKEADFNNRYNFTQMLKDQIKGKNDSWAIRWYMSAFLRGMFTLYPARSYVQNIGNDDSGTHCGASNALKITLNNNYNFKPIEIKEDLEVKEKIGQFLGSIQVSYFEKIKLKIKRLFL